MITEDYVSFEVAKLLKQKGFDEPFFFFYRTDDEVKNIHHACNANAISYHQKYIDDEVVNAPTLQMAMKWLREVHNIIISPYALSLGYYFEIFDLTNRNITGCKPLYQVGIPNKKEVLSTYEKACDAAIKYCLENLI